MIKRSEAKILFKPPWRANIFLQVIILALYIYHFFAWMVEERFNSLLLYFTSLYFHTRFLQIRMHEFAQDDDQEPLLSFVMPILADNSQISTQIFFQSKFLLNKASEYSVSERQQIWAFFSFQAHSSKRPQRTLVLPHFSGVLLR